jgi:hypothetical protein
MSNSNSIEIRSITQSALRSTNNHTISTLGNRQDTKFFKKPNEKTFDGVEITVSKFPDIMTTYREKENDKIRVPSGRKFKINQKLQNVAKIREKFLKVKKDLLGIDNDKNVNKHSLPVKNKSHKESNKMLQSFLADKSIKTKNTIVLSSRREEGFVKKNYTNFNSSILNNITPEASSKNIPHVNTNNRSPSLIKIEYNKSIKDLKEKINFSTINTDKPESSLKQFRFFNSTSRSNFKDDSRYKKKLMSSGLDNKKMIKGKLIQTFGKNFVIDKDTMDHLVRKYFKIKISFLE